MRHKGLFCDFVHSGSDYLSIKDIELYDVFLLDINVPDLDGMEICRLIRERNETVSIIMLTAYSDILHKSKAFLAGADDYLVKPFLLDELYLRIQSLQRRLSKQGATGNEIVVEDLIIKTDDSKVYRAGREIYLTPREYQLLLTLAEAGGKTVSKKDISSRIWNIHLNSNLSTIEVYINFLRKKLDRDHEVKLIHTRTGYGYYLRSDLKRDEA